MKNPKEKQFRSKADDFAYAHRNDRSAGKGDSPRFRFSESYRETYERIFKKGSKSG
jgi:hypothetical protein|tara:strand:+ start:511 stop:678 length:168 start_codon:yes stop_codon:yes gene_type:complete